MGTVDSAREWILLAMVVATAIFGFGAWGAIQESKIRRLQEWQELRPGHGEMAITLQRSQDNAARLQAPRYSADDHKSYAARVAEEFSEVRAEIRQVRDVIEGVRTIVASNDSAVHSQQAAVLNYINELYRLDVAIDNRVRRLEIIEGLSVEPSVHKGAPAE